MGLSSVQYGGITFFLGVGLGVIIYQLYQRMRTGQNKSKNVELSAYEQYIYTHRVDPQTMQITWGDIAGLEEVINELKEKMIFPVQNRHRFRESRLLQPPKGVLLYGPPGCGKTLIAKATAKEKDFTFINLKPSTLTDIFYGESQNLTAALFSLASKLGPTIIFIDEIDSFLRTRSSRDHEVTAMMKAQFMSLWDGLETDHQCKVIIMGATNRPEDIDPAILRRMPTKIHIKLPNIEQRKQILRLILKNAKVDPLINLSHIARETEGFSGSDLKEICRDAALLCAQEIMDSDTEVSGVSSLSDDCIRPITQDDLQKATTKMKESKSLGGLTLDDVLCGIKRVIYCCNKICSTGVTVVQGVGKLTCNRKVAGSIPPHPLSWSLCPWARHFTYHLLVLANNNPQGWRDMAASLLSVSPRAAVAATVACLH